MLSREILVLLACSASAIAETVHGAVVFSRHGDRTSKHYSGYGLTSLGFQQNFQVGTSYRERYLAADSPQRILNISEDRYVPSQIYGSAPEQRVLVNTAEAFFQGLYPPLDGLDPELAAQELNNGSDISNPLSGYQYVYLQAADGASPNTIWIKGDDGCPAVTSAQDSFETSAEFTSRVESTKSFYEGFWDLLENVYDYTRDMMSYENAYDIFDLINVAQIHNSTVPRNVSDEEMLQLRTLADSWEFGTNFNASEPGRSIGGRTLMGAIYRQLNQTVATEGRLKFSLLAGSYDTFLAFFGLSDLTAADTDFFGLPDYASTMAFELFTAEDMTSFPEDASTLNVRFLFKNGTTGALEQFPLFGTTDDALSWADFAAQVEERGITEVSQWCDICSSTEDFCLPYQTESGNGSNGNGGLSNAEAGVIGAMVTLGVVAIVGALAFVLMRRRRRSAAMPVHEKSLSISSGSDKA